MPKTKKKKLVIRFNDTLSAQQSGAGWVLKGKRGGAHFFSSLRDLVAYLVVVSPDLLLGSVDAPLSPTEFLARMDELISMLSVTIPDCTCQS